MAGRIQWKIVTMKIDRRSDDVYDYVMNPENFAEWATSFCRSVRRTEDGEWRLETTDGEMTLRFAERNPYGIMDHYVRKGTGPERLNPARVVPDGTGSKAIFTVFLAEDAADRELAMDFRDVESDLRTLKSVLER